MTERGIAVRLASLYDNRSLRGYVRWKVNSDPVYAAVAERLRDTVAPIVDIGCGVGLLAFYLRESGINVPITGVDFDERKIAVARIAARQYPNVEFVTGDAREFLRDGCSVTLLDVLQYVGVEAGQQILARAAHAAAPGGIVVVRSGIRDRSWRFALTRATDFLGRTMRWMRGETLQYPTRAEIVAPFDGFATEIVPLWGKTPFNNYLFVFRRSA